MNKTDFRVVTCTNENSTYINFWPTMAENWKWYGINEVVCGFITERSEDDPLVKEMRQYGKVILFKPLPGVQPFAQAKTTRMYLASIMQDLFNIVADIDLYILNKQETWSKWFSQIEEDKLFCLITGDKGPYKGTNQGKFPMCFTTARSDIWQQILNPKNLPYEEMFNTFFNIKKYDTYESVNKPNIHFSDESLLRYLISEWDSYNSKFGYNHPKCTSVIRDDWQFGRALRRIDRLNFRMELNKLNKGYYYDSAPVRPFTQNQDKIKPILDYLNIESNILHNF